MGTGCEKRKIPLTWTLSEFHGFICQTFPTICLSVIGFTLAKANKKRKLIRVEANSVSDLKQQIGRSRLYIIPNANIHLPGQVGYEDLYFGF